MQLITQFLQRHAVIAGICLAVIAFAGASTPVSSTSSRTLMAIELPRQAAPAVVDLAVTAAPEPTLKQATVRHGDTLSDLFLREGIRTADTYALLNSGSNAAKALARLTPGETLSYALSDGRLTLLQRHLSRLKTQHFVRTDNGFEVRLEEIKPEIRPAFKAAVITSSLYEAAERVDIPLEITMELAGIFGGVMDFVYDPRKGDTFSVLYEALYVNGEHIGNGEIIAAHYNNAGEQHEAFRYTDSNGDSGYYSRNGTSMRKAFLRAPVDFRRISSSFNPNRLHPIFKIKRPHRGIDYAAARGTPVFAAGDGRVVTATYNKASGHHIVIQHGPRYQTRYLHLHKRRVKTGQKIRQGQVVGTVGSSGYATGPHLHYEFLLDGVHRNPRTILNKLPKAHSIPTSEREHFENAIDPLAKQFAAYQKTVLFASSGQRSKKNT